MFSTLESELELKMELKLKLESELQVDLSGCVASGIYVLQWNIFTTISDATRGERKQGVTAEAGAGAWAGKACQQQAIKL